MWPASTCFHHGVLRGNHKSRRASHHVRHERFEVLDGLFPFVLLPFSVDLFGLFWSGLLHLPLPLSEAGLDARLPLQLSFLVNVDALLGGTMIQQGQMLHQSHRCVWNLEHIKTEVFLHSKSCSYLGLFFHVAYRTVRWKQSNLLEEVKSIVTEKRQKMSENEHVQHGRQDVLGVHWRVLQPRFKIDNSIRGLLVSCVFCLS